MPVQNRRRFYFSRASVSALGLIVLVRGVIVRYNVHARFMAARREIAVRFRRRRNDALILSGDVLREGNVVGFFYKQPGQDPATSNPGCDVIIVRSSDGDFRHISLPDARHQKLEQRGLRAPLRLGADKINPISAAAKNRLSRFLSGCAARCRGKPDAPVSAILDKIAKAGYDIWIAGGAVRDLLLDDGDPTKVNDLDLSGTVPHQLFYDEFSKQLAGQYGLRVTYSKKNGVQSLLQPTESDGTTRMIPIFQYATLKCTVNHPARYPIHWFDHDLADDVLWRDVTINSLFFDAARSLLVDPSGEGLRDLGNMRLRPIRLTLAWAPQAAIALFRILKMADKYKSKGIVSEPAREFLTENIRTSKREFFALDPDEQKLLVAGKFYHDDIEMKADSDLTRLSDAAYLVGLNGNLDWAEIIAQVQMVANL